MQKPTQAEVNEFSAEVGDNLVDPEYFWLHYTENGWMRGKQPVRNWKKTYRMWVMKARKNKGKGSVTDYVRSLI